MVDQPHTQGQRMCSMIDASDDLLIWLSLVRSLRPGLFTGAAEFGIGHGPSRTSMTVLSTPLSISSVLFLSI